MGLDSSSKGTTQDYIPGILDTERWKYAGINHYATLADLVRDLTLERGNIAAGNGIWRDRMRFRVAGEACERIFSLSTAAGSASANAAASHVRTCVLSGGREVLLGNETNTVTTGAGVPGGGAPGDVFDQKDVKVFWTKSATLWEITDKTDKVPTAIGRGLVIAGHSRVQQQYQQSATILATLARSISIAQALTGHPFEIVNNAGVSGDSIAGLRARFFNANGGAGFGANGDTGVTVTSAPGVLGLDGVTDVFIDIGFNELYGALTPAATLTPQLKVLFDWVTQSGRKLWAVTQVLQNSAASGWAVSSARECLLFNDFIRAYCRSTSNAILVDFADALADPLSATAESAAGNFRDGLTHENNFGAEKEAALLAPLFAQQVPQRRGLLPSSNAATSTLDNALTQLQPNPLRVGTAAITATGYSGNAAGAEMANANFVRGGSASAVLSSVPRADGYGYDQKIVCTFTAAGETLETRYPDIHLDPQVVKGGKYMAVAEVSRTGPSGAQLAAADNLRGLQIYLQYNDGTTNYLTYDQKVDASDTAAVGSKTFLLKTPVFTIPAGGTISLLRAAFTIVGNGAGSPEVKIGRLAIRRVLP